MGRGIDPLPVLAYEVDETLDGFGFGDVEFHGGFADVEVDLSGSAADVAEIGVGHFTGTVDDAAHDSDAHALEVSGRCADFLGGGLEIEKGAAAGRAGDVIGFEDAGACGLQDVVGEAKGLTRGSFSAHEDCIADAIAKEGTDVLGGGEEGFEEIGFAGGRVQGVLEEDGVAWICLESEHAEGMDGGERDAVGDGDEARFGFGIQGGEGGCVARVDLDDAGFFRDDLGLEVAHVGDLVGECVPAFLGCEYAHGFVSAEFVALDGDGGTTASFVGERVVGWREGGRCFFRRAGEINECLGDWNFVDGVFGEGDADGIADAVGEEGADADDGFDAAVFAIASFGDAEVDGVVPIGAFGIEASDEEAVGLDHDLWVRGLHGEDEVVVVVIASDAGKLEGAFAHAEGGVAIAVHDAIRERAVVRTDAHGAAEILAECHQWNELVADFFQLGFVLVVGVFADFEFLLIDVVAGIDADFFDPLGGFHGGIRFEMDVGNEGNVASGGADFSGDVFEIGGVDLGLCGDADDFATGLCKRQDFRDTGRGVAGVRGDHRLHADGVFPADPDISDHDFTGFPPRVAE